MREILFTSIAAAIVFVALSLIPGGPANAEAEQRCHQIGVIAASWIRFLIQPRIDVRTTHCGRHETNGHQCILLHTPRKVKSRLLEYQCRLQRRTHRRLGSTKT